MAKESYEILPDEFNFKPQAPKKKYRKKKSEIKKKSKLAVRMFSYVSSSMVVVSVATGTIPFTEIQISDLKLDTPIIEVIDTDIDIDTDTVIMEEDNTPIDEEINNNDNLPEEEIEEVIIYQNVTCENCSGTGIICPGDPTFGYSRGNGHGYEGCKGTGYSECPDIWCRGSYKICQSCEGSGKEKQHDCEVCGGDGVVECEFCYGTGIAECISIDAHSTCQKCDGSGVLQIVIEN